MFQPRTTGSRPQASVLTALIVTALGSLTLWALIAGAVLAVV